MVCLVKINVRHDSWTLSRTAVTQLVVIEIISVFHCGVMGELDSRRLPRWWSGGVCSAMAVTTTHPLDLVKVQLQTQSKRVPVSHLIANIYKNAGKRDVDSSNGMEWNTK